MANRIRIQAGDVRLLAELSDSPCAQQLLRMLPLEGSASTWGSEIYFPIPLHAEEQPDARDVLEAGEVAYWPPGKAVCIFFGPTPASTDERPRAASAVNPIGRILGESRLLVDVQDGDRVVLEIAE